MKPRLSVITLAVKDLEASVGFYKDGLGWPTEGIVGQDIENGAVAFFNIHEGLQLALWPQESLAKDAGLDGAAPNNPTAFSLGYNVNSKEEADMAFSKAIQAGATSVREPSDTL